MYLLSYNSRIRYLFTISFAVKVIILLLEAREKRRYLSTSDRQKGPEETSSIFSLSVFWWLNTLLKRGFRHVLSLDDLYPVDEGMSSKFLSDQFAHYWKNSKYFIFYCTSEAHTL